MDVECAELHVDSCPVIGRFSLSVFVYTCVCVNADQYMCVGVGLWVGWRGEKGCLCRHTGGVSVKTKALVCVRVCC